MEAGKIIENYNETENGPDELISGIKDVIYQIDEIKKTLENNIKVEDVTFETSLNDNKVRIGIKFGFIQEKSGLCKAGVKEGLKQKNREAQTYYEEISEKLKLAFEKTDFKISEFYSPMEQTINITVKHHNDKN